MEAQSNPNAGRGPRLAVTLLVVAGTVAAFLAIAALWVNRQALDTENWTEASSEMLEDDAIRVALSDYLVDQLYANVDVSGEIRAALPPRAAPLAGPAAGALRNLAERAADELLQRPRVQAVWEGANRTAHVAFLKIVEGGGPVVSTEGGVVALNLKAMLDQLAERTGVGGRVADRVPPDAAELTIMRSDQLDAAQDVADVLKALPIVMVGLMLAFFGGAIALARGRRREAVRAAGIGLVVGGILALLARSLAGDAVVNALASTEAVQPAAESVWRIGTSLLVEAATAAIGYGVVMVFAAWLAGSTRPAVSTRRALAPYLRQPRYAWGGLGVIVLLMLVWAPTPATRSVVPALILVALLALGVEALRRQTVREFPTLTTPGFGPALSAGLGRLRALPASFRARSNGHSVTDSRGGNGADADRLARLERLTELRDKGALDEAEFSNQKRDILATP